MIFKARIVKEIMNIWRLGKGGRARRSKKKEPVVLERKKNAFPKGNSASKKRCDQLC